VTGARPLAPVTLPIQRRASLLFPRDTTLLEAARKGAMKSARSFIGITLSVAPNEIGDARRRFGNIHYLETDYCRDTRRYSPGLQAHTVALCKFPLH
jgi:hypothetical protein